MSFEKNFPSAGLPLVTLVRRKPLFILTMKNNENRLTVPFIESVFGALDEIERIREEENTDPAALITTGFGKFYSNGLDLEDAISTPGFFDNYFLKFLNRLLTFPIPTVAAINGHAFAGGFLMALAHDYRVMRIDRGYMCMNEVDIPIDLHPGMAALVRIKLKPKAFRDCILQAHRFNGAEALDRELVDVIAPEAEVLPKAIELAMKWSGKASAGKIYGLLKEEMYSEASKILTTPGLMPLLVKAKL